MNKRKLLTRLRISAHLDIERGRYIKPIKIPIEKRTCKILNEIEEEKHFILYCSIYDEVRNNFFYKVNAFPSFEHLNLSCLVMAVTLN